MPTRKILPINHSLKVLDCHVHCHLVVAHFETVKRMLGLGKKSRHCHFLHVKLSLGLSVPARMKLLPPTHTIHIIARTVESSFRSPRIFEFLDRLESFGPQTAISIGQLTYKPSFYAEIQTYILPVTVSGASVLLPRWINLAAKLFSSNEVPFTTGASSKGFTDWSDDTVIYWTASHRAVLPSWSFSSKSSLKIRVNVPQLMP